MDSIKKVNDSQNRSNISSIQSTKGYNILDLKNDQKDTENCLKKFKQEYSDLMKKKNEIQSIKSSIQNNDIKSILPKIYSKNSDSSNINLYSSEEFSISNLTDLSSNNSIELIEIDNNSMSDSNQTQELKQKENEYSKHLLKKQNNDKEMSCKYNNYNDQHIDEHKHGKCNKEKIGCLHAESIIKNVQKNQKNQNVQNHKEDCIKLYGMLDGLNNEIIKLKELFSNNTDSNSFCNGFNNHNANRSTDITEMSTGEDFIDNGECRPTPQNTFVAQMMHTNSSDYDLYSESVSDTNQIIYKEVNHNNKNCTNTHCSVHCSEHSYNPYYCD